MNQTYTAVVKESSGWWIGWIEEVPGVNCQEATREELLDCVAEQAICLPRPRYFAGPLSGQ